MEKLASLKLKTVTDTIKEIYGKGLPFEKFVEFVDILSQAGVSVWQVHMLSQNQLGAPGPLTVYATRDGAQPVTLLAFDAKLNSLGTRKAFGLKPWEASA